MLRRTRALFKKFLGWLISSHFLATASLVEDTDADNAKKLTSFSAIIDSTELEDKIDH